MKLELNFEERDIEQLYEAKCESFLSSQMGRFKTWPTYQDVDLSTAQLFSKDSEMLFTDSFLNAKIIYQFYNREGSEDSVMLLSDEAGGWCVVRRINRDRGKK